MAILCVAIIGADNCPIYLRTRTWSQNQTGHVSAEDLRLLYILHSNLDVVEERLGQLTQAKDTYLGLITHSENYRLFALVTATRVKIMVLVGSSSSYIIRDTEARSILKELHFTYVDVTANNPFHTPGSPIKSKHFNKIVDNLFEQP